MSSQEHAVDDKRLSEAEQELVKHRQALAEEETACADAPGTQGTAHRLSEAHFRLARSFETLSQLHRRVGDAYVADYPDS